MEYTRIYEILKSKDIQEVYYEDKPVWVQELKDNVATIGFLNSNKTQDVFIEDLYEDDTYYHNTSNNNPRVKLLLSTKSRHY